MSGIGLAGAVIVSLIVILAMLACCKGMTKVQKPTIKLDGKAAEAFIKYMRAQPRIPIMPPPPHDKHYPVFVKGKTYREAELADHTGVNKENDNGA